jgi:hypothetical protein
MPYFLRSSCGITNWPLVETEDVIILLFTSKILLPAINCTAFVLGSQEVIIALPSTEQLFCMLWSLLADRGLHGKAERRLGAEERRGER